MKRKIWFAFALCLSLVLQGCAAGSGDTPAASVAQSTPQSTASSSSQAAAPESTSNTTLKVAGSTSVAPLMKKLKEAFEADNAGIVLEIQESGSSAGIMATIEGAADIGMSSRDLKDAEKEQGLVDTVIAMDGIAVIVSPDNPVADLTSEQIASIFKGEITNWSEVGGADGQIIVVSREEGSGTRGAFEELLKLEAEVEKDGQKLKESLISADALFENSTGGVKSNIAGSKNSIGYISLGTLDESVKALSVGGVVCTVDTIKDKSYTIARPFLVCTKGEATGASAQLIDFILSDAGQDIVKDQNYININ